MLHSEPIYAASGISQHAMFIDTQCGIAVVERSSSPIATAVWLVSFCGCQQFARFLGACLLLKMGSRLKVMRW